MSRQRTGWVAQLPYSENQLNAAKKQIRAAIAATAARHSRISYTDICSKVTAIWLYPRSPLLAHLLASILADEKKPGGSGVAITAVVVNKTKGMPGGAEVKGFWLGARQAGFTFADPLRFWADSLEATWRLYG
jgi:hypothetical protein